MMNDTVLTRQMIVKWEQEVADLETEITEASSKLNVVRNKLAAAKVIMDEPPPSGAAHSTAAHEPDLMGNDLSSIPFPQAILTLLREAGGKLHRARLKELLIERGVSSDRVCSTYFYTTIMRLKDRRRVRVTGSLIRLAQ